eukprot:gene25913-31296_t
MSGNGIDMKYVESSKREKSFADSFADRAKSIQSIASVAFDDVNKLRLLAKKNPYYASARSITILLAYFIIGCASYYALEGWPVGTSVGFTIVSITTIGYGYHTPSHDGSRLFTIFYDIFGICFVITIFYKAVQSKLMDFFKRRLFPPAEPANAAQATDVASMYRNNMVLFMWNIIVIILCIIVGGAILTVLEDWTFIQGIYFALQTSATIGYGDLDIKSGWTRLFLGCYIIFSTALFAFALNNVARLREKEREIIRLEEIIEKRKDLSFVSELDDGQGVSKEQFVLALLLHCGIIDKQKDVQPWMEKFDILDSRGVGRLYRQDLLAFSALERIDAAEDKDKLDQDKQLLKGPIQSFYSAPIDMLKKGMSFSTAKPRAHSTSFSAHKEAAGNAFRNPLLAESFLDDAVDKIVEVEGDEDDSEEKNV